ncbi:MAG TPA: hypothetical protein VER32_02065, partial [Pyrinomonadaceae bacterium]|nr:hypothetical protein [Pyrinomonadaceae bacterium]
MKHVVLLSGEHESPAEALLEALGAAGLFAVAVPAAAVSSPQVSTTAAASEAHEAAPPPVAVLVEVSSESEPSAVNESAARAAYAWPGVPVVACRRKDSAANGRGPNARNAGPDASTLERMGFSAVADDPAQLPALLRDLEVRGVADEMRAAESPAAEGAGEEGLLTPSSLLLPERLSVRRLRAAFETVASLHFSND